MRPIWVLLGLAIALGGLALWSVPVAGPQATMIVPDEDAASVTGTATFAYLTPTLTWTASWVSSTVVNITVYDCGAQGCAGQNGVAGLTEMANGTGVSGSLSWSGPRSDYYALVVTAPDLASSAALSYGYSAPVAGGIAGLGILGVGIVLIAVGALTRRPDPKPGAVTPPKAPP